MTDQQQHDADALLELMNVPLDLRAGIAAGILEHGLIVPLAEERRRQPPDGFMKMLVGYDPTSYRAPRLNLTTMRGVNAFGLMSSAIAAFMSANAGQSPLAAVGLVIGMLATLDVKNRFDNLSAREAAVLVVSNDLNNEPAQWAE